MDIERFRGISNPEDEQPPQDSQEGGESAEPTEPKDPLAGDPNLAKLERRLQEQGTVIAELEKAGHVAAAKQAEQASRLPGVDLELRISQLREAILALKGPERRILFTPEGDALVHELSEEQQLDYVKEPSRMVEVVLNGALATRLGHDRNGRRDWSGTYQPEVEQRFQNLSELFWDDPTKLVLEMGLGKKSFDRALVRVGFALRDRGEVLPQRERQEKIRRAVEAATTIEDLREIWFEHGGIQTEDGEKTYSVLALERALDLILQSKPIEGHQDEDLFTRMTRSYGLRDKLREILESK